MTIIDGCENRIFPQLRQYLKLLLVGSHQVQKTPSMPCMRVNLRLLSYVWTTLSQPQISHGWLNRLPRTVAAAGGVRNRRLSQKAL